METTLNEMHLSEDSYEFVFPNTFDAKSLGTNPSVALYFTSETSSDKDNGIVSLLKEKSVVIILT